MNPLTRDELCQFQIIVENAHREGWISADAELAAGHTDAVVQITATSGSNVVQKTYTRDPRWPFLLLRDLAWGTYRIWSDCPQTRTSKTG